MVDSSGSVREDRFKMVLEFVANVTRELEMWNDIVRVGVMTFADDAVVQVPLRKYKMKEDIMHATKGIKYSRGKTNTAAAMQVRVKYIFKIAPECNV